MSTHHMKASIEGMLLLKKGKLHHLLEDEGRSLTDTEARAHLKLALAEGKKYLPCGDCEGFDFQKGCPGHPDEK